MAFCMIKHPSGEVYNNFDLPIEPELPPEVWAERIQEELESEGIDIVNIHATQLSESYGCEMTEGIIVSLDPPHGMSPTEATQRAIGFVSFTTPPQQG